jgi:peptidyl-prolyl cis-trans isomerase D
MLMEKLRQGAGGWVAKIFLGLLILSFGVWGIADVFRGVGAQDVAVIGSSKIGAEDFRRLYTERMQQLSRQYGRGISPDQARLLGLDRQILGEMLAENAFDEKASQLGLAIDDATLARRIQADPNFRGPSGNFDPSYFQAVLRNNGFTEARYIAAERRLLVRQQIARALGGEIIAPAVLRDAVSRYEREERNAEFVTLAPRDAGEIPAPTPEQIAAYFEQNKATFRAPEFRKIALLALSPETLMPWIQISDADLQKAYADRKELFSTPEKREVEQIVFPNVEEARAVAERIRGGAKFEDVIIERKLDKKDVALGLVTKRELLDAAVAEAAFALAAGSTSAPVTGRFGPVIVRVVKIEPGREPPLAEVEPLLRRELTIAQARRQMLDLHDKIEDDRASGATLAETARKVGLTPTVIEAVDRSGREPDGTLLANLPARDQLLTGAFAARIGVESDPIEIRAQGAATGYVWYDVLEIAAARERTLEEAKGRVEARWRDEAIGKKLSARAEEIRGKLDAGSTFAAAAPGLAVQTRDKLTRGKPAEGLDTRVLARIFDTAQGKAAVAVPEDGIGRIVFRVTAITMPTDAPTAPLQADALLKGIEDDLVTQYLFRLQSELGVRINDAALKRVVGGERN